MFDRREARRVVHCARGTQQAAVLGAMVAAARERSAGDAGVMGSASAAAAAYAAALARAQMPAAARAAHSVAFDEAFDDDDDSGGGFGGGVDPFGAAAGYGGLGDAGLLGGDSDDDSQLAGPVGSVDTWPPPSLHASASAEALAFSDASGGAAEDGPPALPCAGFTRLWCSRGAEAGPDGTFRPVSLWRPVPPPGYVALGDVAQTGYDPPRSPVACYRADDAGGGTAPPDGFELVWRDAGSGAQERCQLWRPIPPPGFAALGCVATPGGVEPQRGLVRCVALPRVYASDVFEEATWRDAGRPGAWRCSIWQVDNDAATFIARRAHSPPPSGQALGALLY
jgi:hypothetical protein